MRKFAIWLLIGLPFYKSLIAQESINSAGNTLKIENEKLSNVFDQLSTLFNVEFSYATLSIADINVSCDLVLSNRQDCLKLLFDVAHLEYQILENQILIRRKDDIPDNDINSAYIDRKYSLSVVDALTQLPVENAAVYIENSPIGSYTGSTGEVTLSIPDRFADDFLTIKMLGYLPYKFQVAKLDTRQDLLIQQDTSLIGTVSITSKSPDISLNQSDNSIRIKTNTPTSQTSSPIGTDILRNIQMLPGFIAFDDNDASLKMRGSQGEDNLILLDGIPIYNADHYYGIFSSINSLYISDVKLYKNVFPAEYGSKTGSLVSINSKNKADKTLSGTLDLNLLASSAHILLRPIDKLTFQFAGRSTFNNVAENKISSYVDPKLNPLNENQNIDRSPLLSSQPYFSFSDWNAKMAWVDDRLSFDVNAYLSGDHLINSYSTIFRSRNGMDVSENQEVYTQDQEWANKGISSNLSYNLSPMQTLKVNAYLTEYQNDSQTNIIFRQPDSRPPKFNEIKIGRSNYLMDMGVNGSYQFTTKNKNTSIQAGIFFVNHDNSYVISDFDQKNLDVKGDATEIGAFSELTQKIGDKWFNTVGLRLTNYQETDDIYLSPRIYSSYTFDDSWSLKGAYSVNRQFVREVNHENQLGESISFLAMAEKGKIDIGTVKNKMLGFTYRKNNFALDAEFYHRDMDGVLEFALISPGVKMDGKNPPSKDQYRLYSGTGEAYGIDILSKIELGHYESSLSYSLGKVNNSFKEIFKSKAYPARDDRRHQLSSQHSYRIQDWTLSTTFIYASGKPYTNISELNGSQDRDNLNPNMSISYLPAYFRSDIGVNYDLRVANKKVSFGLSVFNFLNRKNIKYLQYIFAVPATNGSQNLKNSVIGTETDLLPRTLNLSVKLSL